MEQPGLRRSINICIDHADLAAHLLHGNRQIGRQRGLADPALAAGHRDQAALHLLGGHRDIDFLDPVQFQQPGLHGNLELAAIPHIETSDVEHQSDPAF